jgi:chemotaxis protein methyltransferase CheR
VSRLLGDAEFAALRVHLRRTAGLEFDESRRPSLAATMHERLSETGSPDVPTYLALLRSPHGASEQQRLLDAVTIQETHFHRARPQLDALRDQLLPPLLRRAAAENRDLVVWSAGCSTGEEPFTLAMLALEAAGRLGLPPRVQVLATDVSTAALEVAAAASYSGRTIDLADPSAIGRWLQPEPDGSHLVRDEVRQLVTFVHHNLVTDPLPFGPGQVDLVVCRHVTIYFSRDTTRSVVEGFREVLGPGGWLLMGPTENLWQVSESFVAVPVGEVFAYRPATATALASTATPPSAAELRLRSVARPRLRPRRSPAIPASRTGSDGRLTDPVRPAASRSLDALAAARTAFDAGDYEGAALRSSELVAQPDVPDAVQVAAYTLLGQARLNRADPVAATGPLQRAVYLDPMAGDAHFLLAVALSGSGKRAAASAAYRAAGLTLTQVPAERARRILDGRRVDELVQLCRRLADDTGGGVEGIRRGA